MGSYAQKQRITKKYYLLSNEFYKSKKWLKARIIIYKSIGKVCLKCRSVKNIQIDHIKPKSKYPRETFNLMNLQPLCSVCNKDKSDKEIIDYRTKDDIDSLVDYCSFHEIDIKKFKNSHTVDSIFFKRPRNLKGWVYINADMPFLKAKINKKQKIKKNRFKMPRKTKSKQLTDYSLAKTNSTINVKKILELQSKIN